MIEEWSRSVEQIILFEKSINARVIGFTSPKEGAGVSLLADAVAQAYARSGLDTLLLDLTRLHDEEPGASSPAHSRETVQTDDPNDSPPKLSKFFPDSGNHDRFASRERLLQTLSGDLGHFAKIVVDLPPVLRLKNDLVSPLAGAAACDTVFLVCGTGRVTRRELVDSIESFKVARIIVGGLVLDDAHG